MTKTTKPPALIKLPTAERVELVAKIHEIIQTTTNEPAEELINFGTALTKIGETLRGISVADARQILKAVAELNGFRL